MPKRCGAGADRPSVLMLCPEAPWPMYGGGALRTASLAHFFATWADLHLVIFRQPDDAAAEPDTPARISWIDLPAHRRDLLSRAARNARRWAQGTPPLIDRFSGFSEQLRSCIAGSHYDLAVIEHFWCAAYVDVLRARCDRVWLDLHNVESEWHQTLARCAPAPARPALRSFARACLGRERELLPRFDQVLVPSGDEARICENSIVYPNALPLLPAPVRREENVIAFSGNLEYQPNIDAVAFFYGRIWPLLRERHADLRWRIVGKNPAAVAGLVRGDERVEFSGPVTDAIGELARAQVCVAPVRAGSGTRLKILEAWAAGAPVVSTSFGARGLGAAAGEEILIADEAESFADAVSELLHSRERRIRVAAAGRRRYEEHFTWEAVWPRLASHFSEMMSNLGSLYTG